MDTIEAIRQRRAVKHYDPDHVITAEEEAQIKRTSCAALRPPTTYKTGASLL